jgi:acyl-coenzyme A thioesterase PaaI-like protein
MRRRQAGSVSKEATGSQALSHFDLFGSHGWVRAVADPADTGTAARVAKAALPGNMRVLNISAWFVRPGLGPRLNVRSNVVQQGRDLAVVRTQILGASGKLVLETTSQHAAAAA